MPQPLSAQAVTPMRHPPASRVPWRRFGLPNTGWVVLVDTLRCRGCAGNAAPPCSDACSVAHNLPPQRRSAAAVRLCSQCIDAPCALACPVDAITQTAQGVLVVDQEICIGCRFCADVCPAGGLMYLDPYTLNPPAHPLPDYTSFQPDGRLSGTVAKCTFCTGRLMSGQMPICAESCPRGAIHVGNLDRNTVTDGRTVGRLDQVLSQRRYAVQEVLPGAGARVVHLF